MLTSRRTMRRRTAAIGGVGMLTLSSALATAAPAHAAPSSRPVAVIVQARAGDLSAAEAAVTAAGGRVGRVLGIINGFAAVIPASEWAGLQTDPAVREIGPDASVHMDSVVPTLGYDPTADDGSLHAIESLIGAPAAWNAGDTGKGVDVALLDTGVSPVSGLDETNKVVNGPDLSVDAQVPGLASLDGYGHGTHMASIMAGRDDSATTVTQYESKSTFVGVAPDARVVNVRVGSVSGAVDVSQVIAGIDWVVQNAHANGLNIRVLNLSFGTDSTQAYTLDPLDYAAEVAWKSGIVVVASAGNDGSGTATLQDPADDPFVIAVGAFDGDAGAKVAGASGVHSGAVASFTNAGNPGRYLDVLAPGVHVLGLDDPGSVVDSTYPTARVGSRFFRGSGTSQAAAVVSGAAALLAQAYPYATPDELKYLLTSSAASLRGVAQSSQGHGLIQVDQAIKTSWATLQSLAATAVTTRATPGQLGTSVITQVAQPWTWSTGTGTLDASRGGSDLVDASGATLTGEKDVWGGTVSTATLANAEAAGTAWVGGAWNGEIVVGAGATPTLWDGSAATAADFTNMRWSNMRWSGTGWSNMRWADNGWDNMRWAGDGWS